MRKFIIALAIIAAFIVGRCTAIFSASLLDVNADCYTISYSGFIHEYSYN